MKYYKKVIQCLWLAVLSQIAVSAHADPQRANQDQAIKLVEKVITDLKKDRDGTVQAINTKSRLYVTGDLYPVVYLMNGSNLAHGQDAKNVGKDMRMKKDSVGNLFVQQRVDMAKTMLAEAKKANREPKGFWLKYFYKDPLSKESLEKSAFCRNADQETVVCAGVYKDE